MRRERFARLAVCAGLASSLVACAAPKDAPVSGARHEELRDQSTDAVAADDMEPAPEPATLADPSPAVEGAELGLRDLGDVERELASNEARLRALGVELPGRAGEGEAVPTPTASPDTGAASDKKAGGSSKPSRPRPPAGDSKPSGKPGKKGKDKSNDATGQVDELDTDAQRDEAKAAGPMPKGGPDEIDRCEAICALSLGTCELRGAICELADDHGEEDDYRSACDRAGEDCEVAEEACRACAE